MPSQIDSENITDVSHARKKLRQTEPTTSKPEPGTSLSDIQERQLHWLWDKRILRGKLTLLDGDPDLGKSLITLDLAARTGPLAYSQGLERLVQRSRVLLLRALKEHIFKQVREVLLLLEVSLSRGLCK